VDKLEGEGQGVSLVAFGINFACLLFYFLSCAMKEFEKRIVSLVVDGVELTISTIVRGCEAPVILFLHGFGSTKEDYVDMVRQEALCGFSFVAYDALGCGETVCGDFPMYANPVVMWRELADFWNE